MEQKRHIEYISMCLFYFFIYGLKSGDRDRQLIRCQVDHYDLERFLQLAVLCGFAKFSEKLVQFKNYRVL